MRKSRLVILLLLLVLTGNAQPQYQFFHLDINDGLSHNQINSFFKDSKGFLWFGTISGLNRFDGYSFKVYKHDYRDTSSISDNFITNIFEDHNKKLWISTGNGMNVYDPLKESISRNIPYYIKELTLPPGNLIKSYKNKNGDIWYLTTARTIFYYSNTTSTVSEINIKARSPFASGIINDIAVDHQGNLWLIYTNGLLMKLDPFNKVALENESLSIIGPQGRQNFNFFVDSDGDVWIYIVGLPSGLFFFDSKNLTFKTFTKEDPQLSISSNLVSGVTEDNNGNIWIGTDHGGLNLIRKSDFKVEVLRHEEDNKKSISQNSINTIYKDDLGIIWIGTYKKGIDYYHESLIKFSLFKRQASNPNSLPYDDVNCFEEDERGNIWIGTNGGGLLYFDRVKNSFKQFIHNPNDPNSLSNDIIVSLCIDHQKKLWIGTYHGGLNYFDGQKFIKFSHDPSNPRSLPDDRVWEILEDSDLNLWVGTLGGGLCLFDRTTKSFTHYRSGNVNSINSEFIFKIIEDKKKNIWVGTSNGISLFNKTTGKFKTLEHNPQDHGSLSNNNVLDIFQDSRDNVWIGTREGLNLYDPITHSFTVFRKEDGLPDNAILTIQEDENQNLWLATPKGLSNMLVSLGSKEIKYRFRNYDVVDGLQGRAFNENATWKTGRGELIFGGANGFNLFNPNDISINTLPPKLIFTDFQIFNSTVKVGEKINGRKILENSISDTDIIVLKHKENMFAIEFAALTYFHPEKNKFRYRLEGFNSDWIHTNVNMRKAVYTNLNPGEYSFVLQAANNDDQWIEGISLKIRVLPPFWRSNLALTIYVLVVLFTLYFARKSILLRAQMTFRLEQERKEAQRRHALDLMKIKFFTNISHEFRTPLSLIVAPIERLINQAKDDQHKQQFQLISRNARRLLNLVNQLLDFRKMEVSELKLNTVNKDIVSFIKDISYSFSDISEKKNIDFSFNSQINELPMLFDMDKIERILFNLLSNAFKFTPEQGRISVDMNLVENEIGIRQLELKVTDNGIGIPKEKIDHIFERFFQLDMAENFINQGSGIGLSITKEFVKMHGGEIFVESEPEIGSCFRVLLPVMDEIEVVESEINEKILSTESITKSGAIDHIKKDGKPLLLIVEDNEDLRFYLKDNLQSFYQVVEAGDGKSAWVLATELLPDLIVSDIIMPGKNGFQLCRNVKDDVRTAHIPVILLSARITEEQKLEGYEMGADEYITKPFNFEILLHKIKRLIKVNRASGKSRYIEIKPKDIEITSMDEKLIMRSTQVVEDNISNSDFSVEELSRELGMSRVNLYKKLLALTGKSPIEFIRLIRLKRAAQLLVKSQLTVSEVAYQVGFNNPKYFTKYFKAEFKILPSQYLEKTKSKVAHEE